MSLVIERLERKLDSLFLVVDALPEGEAKARLADYLCIRIAGLIERVVKQLVGDFMDGASQQEINKYVTTKLSSVTNLNHIKLAKLLESFSIDWQDEYTRNATDAEIASLDSILRLRNSIAHGGDQTTGYSNVKAHYANVKTVIGRLKLIIRKHPRRARARVHA
ncbi:HEPN domain-containing protein [Hymenobacter cellulosilyticus]|uniref:HEPN domain-containing protein n=1 Tax=Hymenobacter cellulosilyticus TaxID=2932248 RepID=A0A8T9QH88_9BACT|nr:HEPN domain-containing protein [Hymenobacter cellulosilyticus]UOQ75210.1 HEPN domain-containing protein [Hymenobacter cellulosilyticus]